jgi:hypothetical protein
MLRWFYRYLGNKINQAYIREQDIEANVAVPISKASRLRESDDIATEPIQFKMYKASGGWAIEFRQYDRRHDKVDTSLYVVNDEMELGNSVSKIITMEALKR